MASFTAIEASDVSQVLKNLFFIIVNNAIALFLNFKVIYQNVVWFNNAIASLVARRSLVFY
ncbi:MAG: hypothetical protein HC784_01605 [Hydrococcus sp. CSU_1_8]|nr:hypothetical protein [Hydrococcus sp. CSU_1_8]